MLFGVDTRGIDEVKTYRHVQLQLLRVETETREL